MGFFGSSEEQTLESTGEVNNNVIVANPVDVQSDKITTLLTIITVLKVLEICYIGYKSFHRHMKKKYSQQQ